MGIEIKISIITPSLNSEKFIKKNLQSIHLKQKGRFTIEHIIVDGTSKDNTIKIINEFKKKYKANIKLIRGKDKNMYDAINKGMKLVTGDVWACLNTDDQYIPGIFSTIVDEFKKQPETEVVYGSLEYVNEKGNFERKLYLPKFDVDFLILAKASANIYQPAAFLKKSVIKKVGFFNTKYNYASDYDYFIRVGLNCKLKQIEKPFTKFTLHDNSITWGNKKTATVQKKESEEISAKYVKIAGINKKSIKIKLFLHYLRQIKLKNLKYLFKRTIKKFV